MKHITLPSGVVFYLGQNGWFTGHDGCLATPQEAQLLALLSEPSRPRPLKYRGEYYIYHDESWVAVTDITYPSLEISSDLERIVNER